MPGPEDTLRRRLPSAVPLLAALLVPVPLLVLAHQLRARGVTSFASVRWDVDADRSWIEVLGYVYVGLAAAVLLRLASRRAGAVYAAWAGVLAFVLLDDAAELHERGGAWLADRFAFPTPPGLRELDVGELLTWAVLGAVVLAGLVAAHRRSPVAAKRDSWSLAGIVVYLMVFAVAVDMLHIAAMAVLPAGRVDAAIVFLEAAGEASAMAGFLAFAVHVARRPTDGPADLTAGAAPRVIDLRETTGARSPATLPRG